MPGLARIASRPAGRAMEGNRMKIPWIWMGRVFSLALAVALFVMALAPATGVAGAGEESADTLPMVLDTSPSSGARDVPSEAVITIVFSKNMNASTFNANNIRAFNPMDLDLFELDISYDNDTRTLTLRPTGELLASAHLYTGDAPGFHYGARITLTLNARTTGNRRGISDIHGNGLDGNGDGRASDFVLGFFVEGGHMENYPDYVIYIFIVVMLALGLAIAASYAVPAVRKARERKEEGGRGDGGGSGAAEKKDAPKPPEKGGG